MLTLLSGIYESEGVLTERGTPALQAACPSCRACWAREQGRMPTVRQAADAKALGLRSESGSIFWPWAGDRYERGGVCLIGLNINNAHSGADQDDWWAMSVEYAIAGHFVTALASGKRTWKRSPFAYRSMCTAQAVLDSLGGSTPRLEIPAEQAADTYQQIARIQAVKCSTSHDASRPTREMLENCPGRYASPELSTLMPGVLIGLGRGAAVALDALGPIDWTEEGEHFSRGHLRFGERHADVLLIPHPSSRGGRWRIGQEELVASLSHRPLEPVDPA